MNISRNIVAASLFLCWAGLLSARALAAAIYATKPSGSYEIGLSQVGNFLPGCAWLSFTAAVLVLVFSQLRESK